MSRKSVRKAATHLRNWSEATVADDIWTIKGLRDTTMMIGVRIARIRCDAGDAGPWVVDALCHGKWAAHPMPNSFVPTTNGGFAVTHIPSGMSIGSIAEDLTLSQALWIALQLDWKLWDPIAGRPLRLPRRGRRLLSGWAYVVEGIVARALAEVP